MSASDTFVARLTPAGTGAIAVLALRGPGAWGALRDVFRPAGEKTRQRFADFAHTAREGQFWLGRLGDAAGGADEVVLSLRRTGPAPWLEIHCHGGRQVVAMIEDVLSARGVTACPWPELLRRTTGDAAQATATQALAAATTARTAAILLDQYHGAFAGAVSAVLDALRRHAGDEASRRLRDLARWCDLGRRLTTPWQVVVAGAPNVGKSSLVNRFAGYQRSIVAPTPGTTRDRVAVPLAIDGWPVVLTDTAGLRTEADILEKQGIDLAVAAAREADLCLWLVDASAAPEWPGETLPNTLTVINKTDLPPAWDIESVPNALRVSAETGTGLDELCAAVARRLVPDVPPPGSAVPFTPHLAGCVETALARVEGGQIGSAREVLDRVWEYGHPLAG